MMNLGIFQKSQIMTDKPVERYLFFSWNVDGYDDYIHPRLTFLLQQYSPDIVFLSETKRPLTELAARFATFEKYNYVVNVHVPSNFHGVAMLIRKPHTFSQMAINMNIPVRKDTKSTEAATGRVIVINFNNEMYVIGSYTPNSGRSDQVKLDYRTKVWDPAFYALLEILRKSGPTVWMGDINVALDEIDVSNPSTMSSYAGFTLPERNNFRAILNTKQWFDAWRQQHPNAKQYTWVGATYKPNYGMRLDNILVSENLLSKVSETFMICEGKATADHIPVCIYLSK